MFFAPASAGASSVLFLRYATGTCGRAVALAGLRPDINANFKCLFGPRLADRKADWPSRLLPRSQACRMARARRLRAKSGRDDRLRELAVTFGRGDDVARRTPLGHGVGGRIAHGGTDTRCSTASPVQRTGFH